MSLLRRFSIFGRVSGNEAEVTSSGELKVLSTNSLPNYISTPNTTNILLGSNETFTGAWEDVSEYTTIAVAILGSLSTANGTLFVDLSQDGVIFNPLPFIVSDPTFDLPHIINIVEKYYRIRYINGSIAQTGTFNLQTKISNAQELGLNHKMGDVISAKHEGQIVKSVITGSNPSDSYVNFKADGTAFKTITNLDVLEVFDSGILSTIGFTQVQTHVLSDQNGTATFTFYSDSAGTDVIRTLSMSYLASQGLSTLSTLIFSDYVRYQYTNGAIAQTDFYFTSKLITKSLSGQIISLESSVVNGMVANLGRSVTAGKLPDNTYDNVILNEFKAIKVDTTSDIQTYSSSITGVASAILLPQDVFTITGSATKIIRVSKFVISATQGSNGTANLRILKRYTANTGGIPVTLTNVPFDSFNNSGTAVVRTYFTLGSAPILGTLVGEIASEKVFISNGNSVGDRTKFEFGIRPSQLPTLRGINEVLAFNLNGVTLTGGNINVYIEWTESNY